MPTEPFRREEQNPRKPIAVEKMAGVCRKKSAAAPAGTESEDHLTYGCVYGADEEAWRE